jgi:hypothetical protein
MSALALIANRKRTKRNAETNQITTVTGVIYAKAKTITAKTVKRV